MIATLKLSLRNLLRYKRRTLLTSLLITLGVVAMLLFVAAAGSFKGVMIGQITDSMLGHLEIHRRGYTASMDNLPLNLSMQPRALDKAQEVLKAEPAVAAWSVRIKLGAMFSNYTETTSIRLNGINAAAEDAAAPALRERIIDGDKAAPLVAAGQILIPELIAKGMKVKVGDTVVLIATNLDGSVNGKNFTIRGILEPVTGPGGRDGYLDIADARDLLRLEDEQAMEIAVRLKDLGKMEAVKTQLEAALAELTNK